jgi:hypothetical protein
MTAHREPTAWMSACTMSTRSSTVRAEVPTRYRRVQRRADRCSRLRAIRSARVQALWLCVGHREDAPDWHGKEGVAGSSPAEGSRRPRWRGFVAQERFVAAHTAAMEASGSTLRRGGCCGAVRSGARGRGVRRVEELSTRRAPCSKGQPAAQRGWQRCPLSRLRATCPLREVAHHWAPVGIGARQRDLPVNASRPLARRPWGSDVAMNPRRVSMRRGS